MNEIIRMTKVQIINQFRPAKSSTRSSRGRIAIYIGLAFCYITVMGTVCYYLYNIATGLKGSPYLADLLLMIYLGGAMMVLFFGIPSIISTVYMSKDTEFLSSLPVSSGKIFLSKLLVVYIYEFITTFAIIVIPLIVVGIGATQGPLYYLIILFSAFLVPALPIAFASLLSVPLMYLVSFFKNKGAFSTIAVIILYLIIIGAYMYLTFSINMIMQHIDPQDIQQILVSIESALNVIRNTFFPLYALACVAVLKDNWGLGLFLSGLSNIAIAVGSLILLFAIAYIISNLVFSRSAAAQNEAAKNLNQKGEYVETPVLKSLMMRDFKEIVRTTTFGFQYLAGVILAPFFVFFTSSIYSFAGASAGGSDLQYIIDIFKIMMPFWALLFMGSGMNLSAATAITREGSKFYLSKLLPVSPKVQIKAKLYLSLIITYISVGLSLVVMFILGIEVIEAIFITVIAILHTLGYAMFALRFDLEKPKLDWVNPTDAVKRSRSGTVPMLVNMAIVTLFLAGGIVVYAVAYEIAAYALLLKIGYWALLTILAIVEVIVTGKMLFKDAVNFYERLEI